MRYHVRWGASAEVCRVGDRDSCRPWTTTKPLTFGGPFQRRGYHVTFRRGRWLLRVHQGDVMIYNGMDFMPLSDFDNRGRRPRRDGR